MPDVYRKSCAGRGTIGGRRAGNAPVRVLRTPLRLSAAQFAEKVGVCESTVCYWERGERPVLSVEFMGGDKLKVASDEAESLVKSLNGSGPRLKR